MKKLCLSILLLLPSIFHGQGIQDVLKKSIRAIDTLKTVEYHSSIAQTNPMNGEQLNVSGDCMIRRVPGDTIAGIYYYFTDDRSGFTKYDGKDYYSFHPETDNYILHYSLKDNPEKFRTMKLSYGIIPSCATSSLFYSYSPYSISKEFSEILDKTGQPDSNRTVRFDSTSDVKGAKFYIVRIEEKGDPYTSTWKAVIENHSYLPVSFTKEFNGGFLILNNDSIPLSQKTEVRFTRYSSRIENLDYFLGKESLPRGIQILREMPVSKPLETGTPLPSWNLPELASNRIVQSDSLRGKVLVINFTATWCFHCTEGTIVMKQLSRDYQDNEDIMFISIFSSPADNPDKVSRYSTQRGLPGIILYDASGMEKQYHISGYPAFYVAGRDGNIAGSFPGYGPDLKKHLETLIDGCLKANGEDNPSGSQPK